MKQVENNFQFLLKSLHALKQVKRSGFSVSCLVYENISAWEKLPI